MSDLEKKNRKHMPPRLTYLVNVHPRLHFCRDAALMRLSGGWDRLAYADKVEQKEEYGLYLGGVPLAEAKIPGCGTCGTVLYAGYGDGLINEEKCAAVRDQINNGYEGLKRSADFLAPIIGLMKSGLYLAADFDLFPVRVRGKSYDYFWDAEPLHNSTSQYNYDHTLNFNFGEELHFKHYHHGWGGDGVSYNQPLFLAPSQRASHFDPARVDAYRRRIHEGNSFPRAIAMYLSGGVALLLDGHHKAAACAAEGVPVKTLVIFQVTPEALLEDALDAQKRLYLQRDLLICDGNGVQLGALNSMENNGKQMEAWKAEKIPWGRVPDEYRTEHFYDYPNAELLAEVSEIPTDKIRMWIESEMRKSGDMHDRNIMRLLNVYAKLFPEDKWLSAAERAWLEKEFY